MTRHIAFLRAINVAGHAIVKMTDLRDAFAAAGCKDPRTYIQSGNVVFDCLGSKSAAQFEKVRKSVGKLIGAEPQIVFRTLDEMEAIVKMDPFKRFRSESINKLYVVFLAQEPATRPKLPVIHSKEGLEAIAMDNLHVFIVSRPKPNGFFGFPNNFIEKELGIAATSRNWSTVTKIIDFAKKT